MTQRKFEFALGLSQIGKIGTENREESPRLGEHCEKMYRGGGTVRLGAMGTPV